MSPLLKVVCDKTDCAFYKKLQGDSNTYCTHGDKAHHLIEDACPLYRPDWNKAEDKVAALRKRFGIGK